MKGCTHKILPTQGLNEYANFLLHTANLKTRPKYVFSNERMLFQ